MEVISGLLKGEQIRKTDMGTWEPKEILEGNKEPPWETLIIRANFAILLEMTELKVHNSPLQKSLL